MKGRGKLGSWEWLQPLLGRSGLVEVGVEVVHGGGGKVAAGEAYVAFGGAGLAGLGEERVAGATSSRTGACP